MNKSANEIFWDSISTTLVWPKINVRQNIINKRDKIALKNGLKIKMA